MRRMHKLVVVMVVSLFAGACVGPEGPAGPPGAQGPMGSPGGGASFVAASTDDGATWQAAGGSSNGNLALRDVVLTGRAGLPAAATVVLISIDACAGGRLPLSGTQRDTVVTVGEPRVSPQSYSFSTYIDCDWDSAQDRPRRFLTEQIWVRLDGNQTLELGFREYSGLNSSTMEYRLRVLGWMP